MSLGFDAIVVPRGAEAGAVTRGWPAPRRPVVVRVPAGVAAGAGLDAAPLGATALVLGLCGALDPVLRVGDTVVYARIADSGETIELDAELVAACAVACDRAPRDAAAVAHVVAGVAEKAALRKATGAAVIDMEAASIARAFHRRGVRVAMVRVVSDDAGNDLPDLRGIYDRDGALRPAALGLALLRTPRRGLRFIVHALQALDALRATAQRLSLSAGD